MHTDTKFFTNSEGNSLYDRFNKTLSHNTRFFDVLVWYFRSSWFFNLYKSLEDIEKIRILVWLDVDKKSFEIIENLSSKEARDQYLLSVKKEFETSDDKKEVEEWIKKFIEFIETKKLEIRVYPKASIHAKVYIIRKDHEKSPDYFWSVITGSSNFSMAGLKNNLEFNVELKDTPDVKYALEEFEKLWEDWVDVSQEYVDTVKKRNLVKRYYNSLRFILKVFVWIFQHKNRRR